MGLRNKLEKAAPHFEKGGKWEKYYSIFEMVDTFLYTPKDTTNAAPHVRDAADLKRIMSFVVLATIPCLMIGCWNVGFQFLQNGGTVDPTWRGGIMDIVGYGSNLQMFVHGLTYFLPIYIVTLVAGGIWEVLFASVRKHDVNEGFLVTSMLFALILPPTIDLWKVALGISFGVVLGKEVFGGTGKNFLNPALTGRAFLFFAFAGDMTGEKNWVATDGLTGASPLGTGNGGGMDAVTGNADKGIEAAFDWTDAFIGAVPGCIGETSTLAILLGGAFLIYTRIASFRIIFGTFIGMVLTALLFNALADKTVGYKLAEMPWEWHLVSGGFAFGMIFMATDPVSASMTNTGRWIFGLLIGFMCVMIRVFNPGFPEGMMLAILFANIFAPTIDNFVVQRNVKKRLARASAA